MDPALRARAIEARTALIAGTLRGSALADLLQSIAWDERDAFTDELLMIGPPAPDIPLPRGGVPYLPCGVDEILALVRDVPLRAGEDELVDIGSGLGRVAILAHLLSGVRASGVEIQPQLVECARATCNALGLTTVTFVHANAAESPVDGTVFFLYAPCNGPMLVAVIDRLAEVARRKPITVCTVGLELPDVPWLSPRTSSSYTLSIYASGTVPR